MATTKENVIIEVSERGARTVKRSIDDISQSSKQADTQLQSLKNTFIGLGLAVSVTQVIQLADSYTVLLNRLKLVTTGTENLNRVSKELFDISNRNFQNFQATAALYAKFAAATETLGISQSRLLGVIESVGKAAIISGSAAANQAAALEQLAQAVGSNNFAGDELKSVAENAPRIGKVIADGLGVPIGALKELGAQGKINTQIIIDAFEKAKNVLENEFAQTVPTVGNAMTVLNNQLVRTFGLFDQGVGGTALLAKLILGLANNMETLLRVVIAASIALGVNYAVKGVGAAITATRALTAAIAANPLGAIAVGATVAVSALIAYSDQVSVAEGLTANLADVAVASFESLGTGLSNVVTAISDEFPELKSVFSDVFGFFDLSIAGMLRATGIGIDAIIGTFRGFGESLGAIMRSPLNALILLFTETFNAILRSYNSWLNLIIGRINEVRSTIGLSMIETFKAVQIPLSKGAEEIGNVISDNIAKGIKEQNSAQIEVERIILRAEELAVKRAAASKLGSLNPGGAISPTVDTEAAKALKEREKFIAALKQEEAQAGLTEVAIKRLQAAELGVSDAAEPLIASIEEKNRLLKEQQEATQKLKQDQDQIKRLTEEMFTPQERLNAQIAEFDRLLSIPNSNLTFETYNRLVKDAQDEFNNLKKSGKDAFGSIDQYAIQAARNIQTSLSNFLFDPFDDGLSGMVKGVANAVRRMIAEFAAMKIAQASGLGELFGGGVGGTGSSASITSSLSNLASSGLSFFGTGKGSAGSMLGGLLSSFGSNSFTRGMSGASSAGVFGSGGMNFLGGAGTALGTGAEFGSISSLGAGIGAAAGPLMAAAIATSVLKGFAGDKRLGGGFGNALNTIGDLPIIGDLLPVVPLINGLFGRGPMKQQGTLLQGQIGSEGFESGQLQTRFKAKGGLFRSDKIDFSRIDAVNRETFTDNGKLTEFTAELAKAGNQIFDSINDSAKNTSGILRDVSKNLNLSTAGLDNFSYSLNILTDKGEMIQGEQIGEEITKITDGLVKSVIPDIQKFMKQGETSIDTVTRLGNEFDALGQAVMNLGGTADFARTVIGNMSIEARSNLIEMAGGVDALAAATRYFNENYLTTEEKVKPLISQLTDAGNSIGLTYTTDVTKDQIKAIIQSTDTTEEVRLTLLKWLPVIDLVRDSMASLVPPIAEVTDTVTQTVDDFAGTIKTLQDSLVSKYKEERERLTSTINRFKDFGSTLKDFQDNLLLGELSPLTPEQKLNEARNQFNRTRSAALGGDETAIAKLPEVMEDFLKASRVVNASGPAFNSDFQLVQDVLNSTQIVIKSQTDLLQEQLDTMDDEISQLVDINDNTKTLVDMMKELATAVLNGQGNKDITTQQIQDFVRANPNLTPQQLGSAAVKYGVSMQQLRDAGVDVTGINQILNGSTVTDKQINDYINSGVSAREVYDAAKANGVTFARISQASGIPMASLENWARENNLPVLDTGTDFVSRSGIAMLHRGEAVAESTMGDTMKDMNDQIKELRAELKEQNNNVVRITALTNAKNAQEIVKSNSDSVDKSVWKQKSKVGRK